MEDSAEASFLSEERDSLTSIAGDALVEAQKKLSCDGMNLRIINSHGNSSSPGLMEAPPTELPFFSLPLLTSTACSSPISPSARTSTLAADSLIAPSQYLVSHESMSVEPANCSPLDSHTVSPVHSFPSASPSNSSIVGLPTATASPIPVRRPRHKPGERRELLTRAVEDVLKLNISMRRAAQKYNLAKSSLCDFVRKNKISLPNLRFKPSVLEMSSSSGSRSCVTGFKRACPDDNELPVTPSSPSKLTCGIGRKHSFVHTDSALSTTASLPLIASVGCDIGYEQIVSSGFYDSTDSVDSCPHTAPYNAIPVSADVGCTQPRCIPHSVISGLPGRTSTLLSFSKPSRIESPWHNSAGLPTQVPLRSWSAHNTHNLTGAGLGSISGCLDRKFPFNSMHQLRQTVESHGLISESGSRPLSDGSFAPTSGPSRDGSDHSTHFGSANEINSHSGDTASRGHTAPPDSFGSRTSPRPLITSLLGSLNQKAQDPSSSTTRAVNLNPPVSSFDPSANGNLSPEEVTATFIINTAPNMNKPNPYTQGLVDFINKSPSPFHAVHAACGILTSSGFRELSESEPWKLRPMDCVFVKKNGSTILAAAVGGKFKPGNGLHLIGAHTDSPCLRLKPVCDRTKEGYVQLGVETYGGGLWYTWFDRELKVAGRAVMANSTGRLEEHLVHIDRPIACVPSLAIHLNREIKTQGFNPNSEQHLLPVLCTSLMDQLNTAEDGSTMDPVPPILDGSRLTATASCGKRRYPTGLLRAITDQLGIPYQVESLELELYLADYQPARIGGLHNEFIHAPRLDNLFNSYTSLSGLVASLPTLSEDTCLRVVCLYDHEEIGSTSTQGANSCHTMNILRRITNALAGGKSAFEGLSDEDSVTISDSHFEESLSKSFLLSADQSHAVHPSYHDRHEVNHKPQFHCGIVLKYNTNQRYATNALTAAAVREIARFAEVPVQEFTNRQDVQCGSTIGPLLSAQLGVPTADVGFAQLAMHSCRELCCTTSVGQAVRFYSAFFEHMPKLWPPC
ncbi:unnamed protein product [Dicrocoelium dendriticum]|nr:unnamed protein product [Dicrocoelium dendriticum]